MNYESPENPRQFCRRRNKSKPHRRKRKHMANQHFQCLNCLNFQNEGSGKNCIREPTKCLKHPTWIHRWICERMIVNCGVAMVVRFFCLLYQSDNQVFWSQMLYFFITFWIILAKPPTTMHSHPRTHIFYLLNWHLQHLEYCLRFSLESIEIN